VKQLQQAEQNREAESRRNAEKLTAAESRVRDAYAGYASAMFGLNEVRGENLRIESTFDIKSWLRRFDTRKNTRFSRFSFPRVNGLAPGSPRCAM
jgi:hypothetical protein